MVQAENEPYLRVLRLSVPRAGGSCTDALPSYVMNLVILFIP
jgi:hypothetical protein